MSKVGGVVTLWLSLTVNISCTSEKVVIALVLLGQLYRCLLRSRESFKGFEASKDSEEKNLPVDPLSFLSKLEDCSCYGEDIFNLVSPYI